MRMPWPTSSGGQEAVVDRRSRHRGEAQLDSGALGNWSAIRIARDTALVETAV
jgi:hypothetical protein